MAKRIGIIGGSGLDNPDLFTIENKTYPQTEYGLPSSELYFGKIGSTDVVLLSRHGKTHTLPPSKINYRANISALKDAGCTHIITSAACGSLRLNLEPGSLVIPDQLIDFTHNRQSTFFESFNEGASNAIHTPMAEPFNQTLRQAFFFAAKQENIAIHDGATLITIEGPRFSTRAESRMFQNWGADLINMTIATECILANEAKIPYAVCAMVTDYDSWNETMPPLKVEELLSTFATNVNTLTKLLVTTINTINQP